MYIKTANSTHLKPSLSALAINAVMLADTLRLLNHSVPL